MLYAIYLDTTTTGMIRQINQTICQMEESTERTSERSLSSPSIKFLDCQMRVMPKSIQAAGEICRG